MRSYDLGRPDQLDACLPRLRELVIKPRSGYGGDSVLIAPLVEEREIAEVQADIKATPGDYVAQEVVMLSSHPTVVDGRLVPRYVDLRAFVTTAGATATIIPGGLYAVGRGALVVNSTGGAGKDTWVLPATSSSSSRDT